MKKILIVNNNLEIGGVQTSLINLLNEIQNFYDVTLLLFHDKKEYRNAIPENVKIIQTRSPFKYFGLSQKMTKRSPFLYSARAFWAILCKLFGRKFVTKLMSIFNKKVEGYDIAISFLHEHGQKVFYGGCNEFILNNVDTKKRITWLHCDFRLSGANNPKSCNLYREFDQIIACSDGCKQSFVQCLPDIADRVVSVRNCNNYKKIKELAGDGFDYDKDAFNIVTVARLSQEKGIERAIEAVRVCIKQGYNVQYHIVGAGPMETVLKAQVKETGLENKVTFYGNQSNPYPYIKGASLFLLTSYHEAAPMVFEEAACLGVPVLATQTTSTEEMISQENAGFVCENSQESITRALLEILAEPSRLEMIARQLKEKQFSNKRAVEQFDKIINE